MLLQFIINGVIAGSIYALIAVGFTIIYRTVKFFHFAHGAVYTIGAYFAYSLFTFFHLDFILCFLLAAIFTAIVGVGINKIVYYPLRLRKAPNLVLLLASFGVFIFLQNLIALIYGNQVLIFGIGPIEEGYKFFSAVITPVQITILAVSIVLMFFLWFFIQKTKLGKAMRAVADDPLAASVVGINPERIILASFAIGSALAGVAGVLISLETNLQPTMGFPAILNGIIASVIGGIGSIPGAMLGGFFLGLAENLGILIVPSEWKNFISLGILIIFLLVRPHGILGKETEKEAI